MSKTELGGESDFSLEEILPHCQSADAHGVEESLEVEGAEKCVEEAEGQHAWDVASGVLQRPALIWYSVSFGYTEWEVMLVPWAVYLLFQGSSFICPLTGKGVSIAFFSSSCENSNLFVSEYRRALVCQDIN